MTVLQTAVDTSITKAQELIHGAIDQASSQLREISLDLHSHPEVGREEHHAHEILTGFLERQGFTVTRSAFGLKTAFMAEYASGDYSPDHHRRVGFCSEYDSLPGLGHACGHNLIAISGLACALAVKTFLEKGVASGKVVLFGTPAEEKLDGKIGIIQKRGFQDNMDVCMMLHPSPKDVHFWAGTAFQDVRVEFRGKSSHAGVAPWEGVNALDAICQAWVNVGLLRQQLQPTDRIHGIITEGGKAANVIPEYTSGHFCVRGTDAARVKELKVAFENCFKAAALATGCEVTFRWREAGMCKNVIQNSVLANTYAQYMQSQFGVELPSRELQEVAGVGGSTDFGNVSYVVPGIHPNFAIGTEAVPHTKQFAEAARTPEAHQRTINAAKALSMVAAHVLLDEDFLKSAKIEYESTVPSEFRE